MIKIYHNPRCRKSREGLAILENSGKEFEVVRYLETVFSVKKITEIINLLGISPIQLVRKTEKIWKENYRGTNMSDANIIRAMIKNPKLIERPIVINKKKAIIGRPAENINSII
ncbi:MAG: arsenate reductase [Polaribacter sp.]|jgi:arsenate reductase